jgi:hypothetical protein
MTAIPTTGRAADEILRELETRCTADTDWRGGRVFSLVYHAGEAPVLVPHPRACRRTC